MDNSEQQSTRSKPEPFAKANSTAPNNEAKLVDDLLAITKFDMDLSATAGFTTLQLAELYLTTVTTAYAEEFAGLREMIMRMKRDGKINITEEEVDAEINTAMNWITGKIPKRVTAVRKCAVMLLSGHLQAQASHAKSTSTAGSFDSAILSTSGGESQNLHAATSSSGAAVENTKEVTLKDIRDAWDKRTILLQKLDEMNFLADELAHAAGKLKLSMGAAKQELGGGDIDGKDVRNGRKEDETDIADSDESAATVQ